MDIIYIEDEETAALIFKLGLVSHGIQVLHIADTQPESMALLDTPPYQVAKVIFFDLWIGTTNGADLARMLRQKGDTRPFYLLTAGENPNPPLLRELKLTYLQKPVREFGKLAETLKALDTKPPPPG